MGAIGWTGSNVGIGFNSNQTGQTGITMQSLTLNLYDVTATTSTLVDSFSLAAPINFTAADLRLQQGNGNALFAFNLDATEAAQFATDVANFGAANLYAGLSASLGCAGTPSSTFSRPMPARTVSRLQYRRRSWPNRRGWAARHYDGLRGAVVPGAQT